MKVVDPKEQKKNDDDATNKFLFIFYTFISTLILVPIFENDGQAFLVSALIGLLFMKCDRILNELEVIRKKLDEK